MKTSEEFLDEMIDQFFSNVPREFKTDFQRKLQSPQRDLVLKVMSEFAKMHVLEALKTAVEKARWNYSGDADHIFHYQDDISVDERSIINSYPLTNIK